MTKLFLVLFILIRIFSSPLASIFQKKLSEQYSSFIINFYTYLILSLSCILKINILNSVNFSFEFCSLVIICGLLCTLGMLCMIKAVNIGEISVLGPINSYKSIISLIIAFFLLREIPTIPELIGIVLIILGSRYILIDDNNQFNFSIIKRKDIQLRFAAMTLTAIEAVLLKKIILISSVEVCFMFWCFMGFFWSVILLILRKDKLHNLKLQSKNIIFMALIALCLGLMQYSTNYVFERMNVGIALCLFQLSSIITVFFGWKVFKEQNIKTKFIGCLIMIAGSYLILLC